MESCGNLDIQEQMWLYIILLTLQATFVPNLPFAKFDYVFCTYLCEKKEYNNIIGPGKITYVRACTYVRTFPESLSLSLALAKYSS